jgi:hypothetical protein
VLIPRSWAAERKWSVINRSGTNPHFFRSLRISFSAVRLFRLDCAQRVEDLALGVDRAPQIDHAEGTLEIDGLPRKKGFRSLTPSGDWSDYARNLPLVQEPRQLVFLAVRPERHTHAACQSAQCNWSGCVDGANRRRACVEAFSYATIEDHALDKSHGLRDLEPEAMEFAL